MGKDDLKLALLIVGVMSVSLLVIAVFGPPFFESFLAAFESGLGIKDAAIWSFFLVVGLFIVFAIVAGDSLIGELQFMIGGFLLFYVFFALMIAWVF